MKERKVLFTAHSKLITRCLPFLLSVFLLCFPLNVNAAVGVGSVWDGTFNLSYTNPRLLLDYTRVMEYVNTGNLSDETHITPIYTSAVYETNQNIKIDIVSNSTDVYLNGTMSIRVNIQTDSPTNSNRYTIVSADPVILSGLFVTINNVTSGWTGTATYDIVIEFDNYYVDQSNISVPILVNYELNSFYNTYTTQLPQEVNFIMTVVSDYHGSVSQYDNLEDVPSLDGYFAEQNSQVINNTTINNDLLQQQIQQDHQDTLNQTNELTNGYQSSLVGSAENDFNVGAGELTDIEDTLSDSSTQFVDSFTSTGFDDSLLDSIAPSMQYVVTWFTNFWNMGGALTKCFTLCFALYIAFFILRVRS